jgi:hypothetical protein
MDFANPLTLVGANLGCIEDADLGERLCKGAMLSFLHELAPSLVHVFFEVSKSYNKPILRRASCGSKTTIVM